MSKCWKWRPSDRPTFSRIIDLIDHVTDKKQNANYVNLRDIIMDDLNGEVIDK